MAAAHRRTRLSSIPRALGRCVPMVLVAVLAALLPSHTARAAEDAMIEAARKQGRVVWLTSQIMSELALPLAAAFKATYGIEVQVNRASPRSMIDRVVQADRTGTSPVDVVDGRSAVIALKRQGMLAALDIANAADLPAGFVDRERMWFATNRFTLSAVVNTELVPDALRPRSFEDLFLPKWTGRIAWSTAPTISGAAGLVGTVLTERGDGPGRALLTRLSAQNITGFELSSRQIIEKVISGEFPIALQVYSTQASGAAAKGTPIAWLPISPVTQTFATVAVPRRAAHPDAARLLVEFLLSRRGQEMFRDADQLPVRADVAPLEPAILPDTGRFRARLITPEEFEAKLEDWTSLARVVFP